MLIDSFTFFNELDLLEGRLEYLYNRVDRFIIVESNRTFNCQLKQLNFKNNQNRYKKYLDKITYIVYENNKVWTSDPWQQEYTQRNYILEGLKDIDNGWIIMGDLDEIPKIDAIDKGINSNISDSYTFEQDLFYYNLKQKHINNWSGNILTTVKKIKEQTPQWFRDNRKNFHHIQHGGWHLSYWGTPEKIKQKIESFSHQEFNRADIKNIDAIKQKILSGSDLYGRIEDKFVSLNLEELDTDLVKYFSNYEVSLT